jgi:hypothetical protein
MWSLSLSAIPICADSPLSSSELEGFAPSLFHYVSAFLFFCSVLHTLFASKMQAYAHKQELAHQQRYRSTERSFRHHVLFFLGEVEIIFALWAIPLAIAIISFFNWETAVNYIDSRNYTEALFVFVILALTATRPIVHIAEVAIIWAARWLGGSLSAWWFTLLTLGPLLGSLLTEAGAMALCALLLSKQFYAHRPSVKLSYATLALLFVNVSVGGVLTTFASPAVLILSRCWHWTNYEMLTLFGWKAALGITLANLIYWFFFRKEFTELDRKSKQNPYTEPTGHPVPWWILLIHLFFIVWVVFVSHYPAIFIASFLFFIGFHQATRNHQYPILLARPMLIALFLGGLVIHGGLQGWWVVPLLEGHSRGSVMGISMLLTGFNDNTAISYLATLIPNWGRPFEYALFTGVIAGGGLTVIGNAPNPAGYSMLKHHFEGGVKPIKLFLSALCPTIILYLIFYLFQVN